jgi:hypothetical protein
MWLAKLDFYLKRGMDQLANPVPVSFDGSDPRWIRRMPDIGTVKLRRTLNTQGCYLHIVLHIGDHGHKLLPGSRDINLPAIGGKVTTD